MFQCAIALLGLTLAGCTRPSSSAQIQLSLPQSISQHSLDQQTAQSDPTAGQVLSHVVINITGDGITIPILHTWDNCSDCNPATIVPSTLGIDNIPQGQSRLVQVIAVYKNSTSNSMDVYYGDSTMDLISPTVSATINVATVSTGTVINGRVMGRYLTAANSGPTGMLNVLYSPGGNKPRMLVDQNQIVNGWMSTMMLSNIKLDFITKETDGTTQELWGGPVSLESTPFSTSNFVAKAGIPVNIRKGNQSGTTTYDPNDATVYVWGYFGNSTYTTSKNVCVDTSVALQNLKVFTSTAAAYTSQPSLGIQSATLPTVDQLASLTTPLTDTYFQGGLASAATPCANATTTDLFTNVLKVGTTLIDGNGNDNAAGFRVPLAPMATNSIVLSTGTPYQVLSGQLLPGAQSVISAVQLYKKISTDNSHNDLADCDLIAAGIGGYVSGGSAGVVNPTSGAFSINTNITSTEAALGVSGVLCPIYSPALQSRRIGVWVDPYIFNNVAPSALANVLIQRASTGGTVGVTGSLISGVCEPVILHRQDSSYVDITNEPAVAYTVSTTNVNAKLFSDSTCLTGNSNTLTGSFANNAGQATVYVQESGASMSVSDNIPLYLTVSSFNSSTNLSVNIPKIIASLSTIDSITCPLVSFSLVRAIEGDMIPGSLISLAATTGINSTVSQMGVYNTSTDCTSGINAVTATGNFTTSGSLAVYIKNISGTSGTGNLTFSFSGADPIFMGTSPMSVPLGLTP